MKPHRPQLLSALAAAGLLAGCGGGGDNPGDGAIRQIGGADPDAAVIVLAVGLFDSTAGVERLLEGVGGYPVLEGPVGRSASGTCAGGGSAAVEKTSATTATLTAAGCKLRTDDNLVYSGTWTFNFVGNFPASGICPAKTTCTVSGTIDVSNARFGYGTARDPVLGRSFDVTTNGLGVRTSRVFVNGETISVNGVTGTVTGSLAQLQLDLSGVAFRVSGTPARTVLQLASPWSASIALGSTLQTAIDKDFDGSIDKRLSIAWSAFLE